MIRNAALCLILGSLAGASGCGPAVGPDQPGRADARETARQIVGSWSAGVDPWKTLTFSDKEYRLTVRNDGGPRTPDEVGDYSFPGGETLELRPADYRPAAEPVKDKDLPAPSPPEHRPSRRYTVRIQGDELRLEGDGVSEVWRREGK